MRSDKHFHVNGSALIDFIPKQNHSIGSAALSEVVQPPLPCSCVGSGLNGTAAPAVGVGLNQQDLQICVIGE